MRNILLAVIMAASSVATAAENPSSSAFIQRTMKMLEASTADFPIEYGRQPSAGSRQLRPGIF